MALRCALSMLKPDEEGRDFIERIVKRLHALSFHMRSYFWLDFQQLNDIYRLVSNLKMFLYMDKI